MTNLDTMKSERDKFRNDLAEAISAGDSEKIGSSFLAYEKALSDRIVAEANGLLGMADCSVLAARGVRQLTSEEHRFYTDFIKSARNDAQTVITNITSALPETVIDSVMEDMVQAYPLLNAIDFTNTSAAVKWVLNAQGAQSAAWGDLNEAITKDLAGAIQIIDLVQCKLSAYMYTTEDMLALGPQWVDRYVRAILVDALSAGLEAGIVDGNGLKQPIGMTRNFNGSFNASTGYSRKTAVTVTSLSPQSYGELLSTLATDGLTGRQRAVGRVILVVNPADYFTKIMPATTLLTPNGQYVSNILPYPTDIIQSVGVPSGHAVLGIAKKYFMGVGTGKGGKLEYSDDFKFLDDLRTYKIKFYGMGRPYDINAFSYLDISGLTSVYPTANITGSIENTPQTS